MTEQKMKIFRDNVHGYIDIPYDYVTSFVDTELFQRLRGIEQTGMRVLYPSARHDRFIHSLGTYFLGHKAFEHFRKNVYSTYNGSTNNHYDVLNDRAKSDRFWEKYRILFEIACLLHDCGHAPFSHTLEFHYDTECIDDKKITPLKAKLLEYNGSTAFKKDYESQGYPGSAHERMSALLVCTEYKNTIDELISRYDLNADSDSNVEFIVRAIIGCKYKYVYNQQNQIKNCFIELLNSNSIDVDSLDYIIRDSKLSGVDNINIDIERLLGSLTLVEITICNNVPFHGQEISANIIEGCIEAFPRQKASFSGNARGKFSISRIESGQMYGMVDLEGCFEVENEATIMNDENPAIISTNGAKHEGKIPICRNYTQISAYGNISEWLHYKGDEINFGVVTNAQISCQSDKITFSSSHINGTIDGKFTGKILGNYLGIITNANVECRLGFHKSSLSVIQNVVTARNYEYQWIYSHHKVAYYSNYLIVDLLKQSIEYLLTRSALSTELSADKELAQMFSWRNMVTDNAEQTIYTIVDTDIFRPTDSDVMNLFNKCYLYCKKDKTFDNPVYKLLSEYYSRNYKQSLWKSYAEFNIFLNEFTPLERTKIFNLFISNSSYNLMDQYGYLSKDWAEEFSKYGLDNVVWVNGDSKLKNLNPDDTFILFKTGPLTYRSISSNNEIKSVSSLNLFYLYYNANGNNLNKDALIRFLKDQLKQ